MLRADLPYLERCRRAAARGLAALSFVTLGFATLAFAILPLSQALAQRANIPGGIDLSEVDWDTVVRAVDAYPGVPLFTMPRVSAQSDLVTLSVRRGDAETALRLIDRLVERYPLVADLHATRAAVVARTGDLQQAVASLDRALDLGFNQAGLLRRLPVFKDLSTDPAFRDVTARDRDPPDVSAPEARPAPVEGQSAFVAARNTSWNPARRRLYARFLKPGELDRREALPRLAEAVRAGEAAGLGGILYDNRDRDHSTLERLAYPRLTFVEYERAAQAAGLDYGLNDWMLFDGITIGNSSTARTAGPLWRSQPRVALTDPLGPRRLAELFQQSHLYVFPEHRDHDPVAEGGFGDVFPANTPFYIVSQGSSGSDKPFLDAALHALAALRPQTRAMLEANGHVAPTLQMILRRSMTPVADDAETYLSGIAHPTVFEAENIDLDRVIEIAQRLTPETLPPAVIIGTLRGFDGRSGQDFFADGFDELQFDTPFSRARIWRSLTPTQRLLTSARPSFQMGQDVVTMRWRLLRGDPERVRIRTLDPGGQRAAIEIDWQGPRAVPGRPEITSGRIDIGVFADNGLEISAPAIISIMLPPRQERVYEPDGKGGLRIAAVDYVPALDEGVYVDPVLFPQRFWEDRYAYAADGALEGWTRIYGEEAEGGAREEAFTATGFRILERDEGGRPTVVESVAYPVRRAPDGTQVVDVRSTGRLFDLIYASEEAVRGVLAPRGLVDAGEGEAAGEAQGAEDGVEGGSVRP